MRKVLLGAGAGAQLSRRYLEAYAPACGAWVKYVALAGEDEVAEEEVQQVAPDRTPAQR
jgi:hypothetical protein